MADAPGELILYTTEDGRSQVQMRAVEGTVWLSQSEMAELFSVTPQNIGQHIHNIYEDGELAEDATGKDFFLVRQEGDRLVRRTVGCYNLEVILAVGYRVRSPRGTQFRQWATTTLREYLVKGFVMDDERLKDPKGVDYFDELLARIRDIRASEKRFYLKVRDIFSTSVDYDSKSPVASTFFATIQNKLVYAVTGHTAAELIVARADPDKPNMGLSCWKGEKVRKADVSVSKNYLDHDEMEMLNILTTQFLDYAELQARRRKTMTMAEWASQTDRFIEMNDFEVLNGAGKVSHEAMLASTGQMFAVFDARRKEIAAALAEAEHEAETSRLLREAVATGISVDDLKAIEQDVRSLRDQSKQQP
ncbi:virulence RhuM family protein [Nonomuraea zeae]|uniref:Virulence RhuM family protein n=1 Tax=Nonomuraea zeae TaxID=1642303 RepID=A0A5S4H2T7_9ACTN|nr:virulence RhuM family protein [Nonomuraea zeae]TMR39568.1 virulence RhuM family protein [Nonomuraea zeae]